MSHRLSNVVRRKFVDYFTTKHDHTFIKSSSVVPKDDSSLSFVNAGMNQFKSLILADSDYYDIKRACNYQKCIRVGGKMCDLDKIGHNFIHHTFFEMLGNWSFNDYGKAQACEWALDFLVNSLNLDPNKLNVTYYKSKSEEDTETRELWLKLGLSPRQVVANETNDNFWEMGPSGPCGISTEIFYPVGNELVEIWNLVFIDRQRVASSGEVVPLRNKFVDTGMGLERILCVLENVESNYDTDLFRDMFHVIERKSGVRAYGGSQTDELDIKYRVLSDHCRLLTIALSDGIMPGRKDAPFMLRSLIKKSLLISRDTFNQTEPKYLIFDLADDTIETLSEAYPELPGSVKHIRRTIAHEWKRFKAYLRSKEPQSIDERKSF